MSRAHKEVRGPCRIVLRRASNYRARLNQSPEPMAGGAVRELRPSRIEVRRFYSTRSVPNMVGCSVHAQANTPAFLARYFQECPAAMSCEPFPSAH
jgi:hypothetical protein